MRAYRVAYDGRPFFGFQRQPDVPTVEDELFDGLRELDLPFTDRPSKYAAAGRTDAGVSAVAQTVAFDAPDWLTPAAFSAPLPDSIRVWAEATAPPDFHATHDATYREYTYHLYAPDTPTDRIDALETALSGRADFHNLTPDDTGTIRTVDLDIEPTDEFLTLNVTAGGFPRHLVRRIATLVEEVISGRRSMAAVDRILGPDPIDGPDGVGPAPAAFLVLTDVGYDLDFESDESTREKTRELFDERRKRHLGIAAAAETITRRL
jgi:tRNA pseudouridine38-40 synthase